MTTTLELMRAANVALLSLAVLALIVWLSDAWSALSVGRRISMLSVRLLLIGGVVGSAIKFWTAAPVDGSIVLVTISATGIIVGQFLARKDRTHLIPAFKVLGIIERADLDGTTPCDHPGCMAAREELRRLARAANR